MSSMHAGNDEKDGILAMLAWPLTTETQKRQRCFRLILNLLYDDDDDDDDNAAAVADGDDGDDGNNDDDGDGDYSQGSALTI